MSNVCDRAHLRIILPRIACCEVVGRPPRARRDHDHIKRGLPPNTNPCGMGAKRAAPARSVQFVLLAGYGIYMAVGLSFIAAGAWYSWYIPHSETDYASYNDRL